MAIKYGLNYLWNANKYSWLQKDSSFASADFGGKITFRSKSLGKSLIYMTSIIVHEARHRRGGWHQLIQNRGDCRWNGSCDKRFSDYKSNAYELAYMWAYGVAARNSTSFSRQAALDTAQSANLKAFQFSPNFNIQTDASLIDPVTAASNSPRRRHA